MARFSLLAAVVPLAAIVLGTLGCHKKPQTFHTEVKITRMQIVRRDDKGTPQTLDVEIDYTACPGEQFETLQGNAAFTQCMSRYKTGETLPATVVWAPTDLGHYDSEVLKIGECERHRDDNDERSYEIVQVCADVVVNGVNVGFHCDRRPSSELLAKCPWFRRL